MLSTYLTYNNRTIASTLKMQIRTVECMRAQLNASDDPLEVVERRFQVRATPCHLTSSKSAWKSTPKCTWMCWIVWWSPGAIRWPVANSGCGSRTRRRSTSPKRPRYYQSGPECGSRTRRRSTSPKRPRYYQSGPEWTWERWQSRGTPHSPKLQHCWNLTIRLFNVISRTLVVGVLPLCREAVGVFYSPSWLGKQKGMKSKI